MNQYIYYKGRWSSRREARWQASCIKRGIIEFEVFYETQNLDVNVDADVGEGTLLDRSPTTYYYVL